MSLELSPEHIQKIAAGILPASCEMLHNGPCIVHWLKNFMLGFKFGMKFYFPLHFMPLILRYKQVLKKPLETLRTALKGCVRSTMVLAVMVLIGKMTVCGYVRTVGTMDSKLMVLSAALINVSAFIETPARISEMAMYVLPRFFDAIWKFLKRRGLVVNLPYGQVILFCMAMAAIMYSHNREPDNIKPMYRKVCDKFFGEN
ncbi:hypothetical protein SteCoe_22818 [Stentor coeruleus]|uniref:Transmembrane protein 135 N-terminal domain-containing protein n=1 Tax=Stentor coeruleus TaxID=5963 RepID=A0A1R2BLH9_9CILI|nr:hypothetical protein SteCoe_22818 [Stentor coeruleus]